MSGRDAPRACPLLVDTHQYPYPRMDTRVKERTDPAGKHLQSIVELLERRPRLLLHRFSATQQALLGGFQRNVFVHANEHTVEHVRARLKIVVVRLRRDAKWAVIRARQEFDHGLERRQSEVLMLNSM